VCHHLERDVSYAASNNAEGILAVSLDVPDLGHARSLEPDFSQEPQSHKIKKLK
jgi:hypothetical protein